LFTDKPNSVGGGVTKIMSNITFTKDQLTAIESGAKNILVSASAGSGKTSVMIARILRLLEAGECLSNFLVCSFTRASAADLVNKLSTRLQGNREQKQMLRFASIGTLHSFCARLLRSYFAKAEIDPDCRLLSDSEAPQIKRQVMEDLLERARTSGCDMLEHLLVVYSKRRKDKPLQDMLLTIHSFLMAKYDYKGWLDTFVDNYTKKTLKANEHFLAVENFDGLLADTLDAKYTLTCIKELSLKFIDEYNAYKQKQNVLDYNDLEQLTLKLLQDTEVLDEVRRVYKYIFVDEYQDINEIQDKIITLISERANLFRVGDIKQSIYRFRLASPQIFLKALDEFSNTRDKDKLLVNLNTNYRSNKNILNFANDVFKNILTRQTSNIDYASNHMLSAGVEQGGSAGSGASKADSDAGEADSSANKVANNCASDGAYGDNVEFTLIAQNKTKGDTKAEGLYDIEKAKLVDDDKNYAKAEALYIDKKISEILTSHKKPDGQAYTYSDIAIISSYKTGYAHTIYKELLKKDIPVNFNKPLTTSTSINVLLDFLRVIDNAYNDYPLAAVLLSEFGGFTEDELAYVASVSKSASGEKNFFWQKFFLSAEFSDKEIERKRQRFLNALSKYRYIASVKNVYELVLEIARDFDLQNAYLTQNDAFDKINGLEQFLDSLQESQLARDLSTYLDSVRLELDSAASSDTQSVRMLSIHESKGLEYPVVFLVGLGQRFNFLDLRRDYIINSDIGLGVRRYDLSKLTHAPTIVKEAVKGIEKKQMMQEELRKLYVALTRAEHFLFLSGKADLDRLTKKLGETKLGETKELDIAKELDKAQSFIDVLNLAFSGDNLKFVYNVLQIEASEASDVGAVNEATGAGKQSKPSKPSGATKPTKAKELKLFSKKPNLKTLKALENSFNYKHLYEASTRLPLKASVSKLKADTEAQSSFFESNFLEADSTITTEQSVYIVDDTKGVEIESKVGKGGKVDKVGKGHSAIDVGNAYHKVFEHLCFDSLSGVLKSASKGAPKGLVNEIASGIKAELARLVTQNIISKNELDLVDVKHIANFYTNPIIQNLFASAKTKRYEQPFVINYRANKISRFKDVAKTEQILVQGIIDLLLIDNNNNAHIIDYKLSKPKNVQYVNEYKKQLEIYKYATENILNTKVENAFIYYIKCGILDKL